MFQHSALRVVPLDRCILHERTDPRRVAKLADRLASEQILSNPPIVGTHPGLDGLIVVDGATRVTALRQLGVPHVIAQVVAYDDPQVSLAGWNHAIGDVSGAAFRAAVQADAGVAVRACRHEEAEAALAADLLLAYAVDGAGACWALDMPAPGQDATALRHAIFASYARLGPITRTLERQYAGESQVLVVFPTYEKTTLVELVLAGHDVPPGITRHAIPERVLRLNLPLRFLREESPLVQKQALLDAWIGERTAAQRMRYYQEPTIVFDE
ncbi:MAG TPA: hypothetical protein VD886_05425 [Herpetosiphonaceae bacterium]|nr:hypothetical protein [Herpetosiphonaceae bacterium]